MAKASDSGPHAVKQIAKFARECLYRTDEDDDKAKFGRFVVRHVVKGNKNAEEVFTLDAPKKAKESWAEDVGLDIYTRLQAEAAVLGGLQRWFVYAYMSNNPETHFARYPVAIQGTEEDDGFESEGTDREGRTAQMMRHIEIVMKVNAAQSMTATNALNQLVGRLSSQVETLMDKRMEAFDLIETMSLRRLEQEKELLTAGARAETMKAVGKRVGDMLIPALANKLAGGKVFEMEGSPVLLMAKSIMTNLAGNEERLSKIMAMLGPEEQIAFMNLYETLSKTEREEKKAKEEEEASNGIAKSAAITVEVVS